LPGGLLDRASNFLSTDQRIEGSNEIATFRAARSRTRDQDQIDSSRQPSPLAPEPLARASLHPIPHHGTAHAPTYRDSQPLRLALPVGGRPGLGLGLPGGRDQQDELARRESTATTRNAPVVLAEAQSVGPLEATGPRRHVYFEATLTARRRRPLARRLLSTARPARVFMRSRKPCFLNRLRRLG